MRWFRFYHDALYDPKVQMLPGHLFKFWVNLLCIASMDERSGALPDVTEIAHRVRQRTARTSAYVTELRQRGLLDVTRGKLKPHNWLKFQYSSDDVSARVKRYRQRSRNGPDNGDVTPPENRDRDQSTDPEQRSVGR